MTVQAKAPRDLIITPRKVSFDYKKSFEANPCWHNDGPVTTHFFNALQSTFPEGERFFIDSARDARDRFGEENLEPKLKEEIRLFIHQEALHGIQHDKWNEALVGLGYKQIIDYDIKEEKRRQISRKKIPANFRLAITAAVEHYTASIAHLFLYKKPELIDGASHPFREVLLYHAVEEIEHKSVCFDLYEKVSGNYMMRVLGLLLATIDIMMVSRRHISFLKTDGLWNWKNKLKAFKLIWGFNGIAFSLFPYIARYLSPSFHPWEVDERADFKNTFGDVLDAAGVQV